jgi:hypothetical protein
MPVRRFLCLAIGGLFLLSGAPSARALTGDGVACVLNVTISFTSTPKMKSAEWDASHLNFTSPTYTISVAQPMDLDSATTGSQSCIYTLAGLGDPYRSTGVTATPTGTSSDLWTCEAVLGTGTWVQGWGPSGSSRPADTTWGQYTITGTWGAWSLVVTETSVPSNYLAVIPLTFANPADALTYSQCIDSSSGVASLALKGVEVYQDP